MDTMEKINETIKENNQSIVFTDKSASFYVDITDFVELSILWKKSSKEILKKL